MVRLDSTIVLTYVLSFLVRLTSSKTDENASFHNNLDKDIIQYNGFNGKISTINGQVFVNWSTNGPWSSSNVTNATVYFLTNYTDKNNMSHHYNISLCHAKKQLNNSWSIQAAKGNLLRFCNESRLCGPFDKSVNALTNSSWSSQREQLSCQFFTTCSHFNNSYGIEILITTDKTNYHCYFGELMIYNQNIPPSIPNVKLYSVKSSSEKAVILWNYFSPSQLCGFGSDVSKNIEFIIQYFKLNQSQHCYFMGERTVRFGENMTIFSNLSGSTNRYTFYFNAKSLINNHTSEFWTKQNYAAESIHKLNKHNVYNSSLTISWLPEWECFNSDILHQIMFCPPEEPKDCIPICQVNFSNNGSASHAVSFSKNIVDFCQRNPSACVIPSKGDDIVDAKWNSSLGVLECTAFKHCLEYLSVFEIKAQTISMTSSKVTHKRNFGHIRMLFENYPSTPSNFDVTKVEQTTATLSWQYNHCLNFTARFEIFLDDQRVYKQDTNHRSKYVYILTKLQPYTQYKVRIKTKNVLALPHQPPAWTKRLSFRTKEGAPLHGPVIQDNERQGNDIILKWKVPSDQLRGVPELYIIEVFDEENRFVWNETLYDGNRTSTVVDGDHLPKCVRLNVFIKICNAPDLCSPATSTQTSAPRCRDNNPSERRSFLEDNKVWVIILAVCVPVLFLLAILVRRNRRKSKLRERLPSLSGVALTSNADYSNVGQPNEYNRLEAE